MLIQLNAQGSIDPRPIFCQDLLKCSTQVQFARYNSDGFLQECNLLDWENQSNSLNVRERIHALAIFLSNLKVRISHVSIFSSQPGIDLIRLCALELGQNYALKNRNAQFTVDIYQLKQGCSPIRDSITVFPGFVINSLIESESNQILIKVLEKLPFSISILLPELSMPIIIDIVSHLPANVFSLKSTAKSPFNFTVASDQTMQGPNSHWQTIGTILNPRAFKQYYKIHSKQIYNFEGISIRSDGESFQFFNAKVGDDTVVLGKRKPNHLHTSSEITDHKKINAEKQSDNGDDTHRQWAQSYLVVHAEPVSEHRARREPATGMNTLRNKLGSDITSRSEFSVRRNGMNK